MSSGFIMSGGVEAINGLFQRYMLAMEMYDNFSLYFFRSIQFGSMEFCFILRTDVPGLITFLHDRNRNNKTQVTAIYFKPHIRYTFCVLKH